ncbi:hypothetical protein AB0F91_39905 [Amycolatopsis sp. NPDC023774]|uniref:hypothetical protein n=1 Tax=Amycolatopsis sp. NPDC023774 TaxID=3155015 RepID=UPI0033E5411A
MGFTVALYFILKRKTSALSKWYVKSLLYAMFSVALSQTQIGGWLAGLLRKIVNLIPGAPVGAIGGALVLLAVIVLVADVWKDRKADRLAQISILLLPLLFVFAAGPIAPTGRNLTDSFANISTNGLAFLTGA